MRVVSWNMAAGFGRNELRHERAWRFLQSVDPDFALLQEVDPPEWAIGHWDERFVFAERRSTNKWGTAILSRDMKLTRYEPDATTAPRLTALYGSAVVAIAKMPEPLWLASMHSDAYPVSAERLAALAHDDVVRCREDAIWELELYAGELIKVFAGSRFIAGGDINSGLLFDEKYGHWRNNWKLFENLAAHGFIDTRRSSEEQRTFFQPNRAEYQLDHVFADATTAAAVADWSVWTLPAVELGLSDHAPVVIEIQL